MSHNALPKNRQKGYESVVGQFPNSLGNLSVQIDEVFA